MNEGLVGLFSSWLNADCGVKSKVARFGMSNSIKGCRKRISWKMLLLRLQAKKTEEYAELQI